MARYSVSGNGQSLFSAFNTGDTTVKLQGRLLYTNSSEFGFTNGDGSTTYVKGEGLVWDSTTHKFTAGTITNIAHYTGGLFNDDLRNITGISAADFQTALEQLTYANSSVHALLTTGDDILTARHMRDDITTGVSLEGSTGNDGLYGSRNADTLSGGDGNDRMVGYGGRDILYGGEGDDKVAGGLGNDTLYGGSGTNVLSGGAGDDIMDGAHINVDGAAFSIDYIYGGSGADSLNAHDGNDRLSGGTGNDALRGGSGDDIQTGGDGADTFTFMNFTFGPRAENESWGIDRITDFEVGVDHLQLIDMMNRSFTYENNAAGQAVITLDALNKITLVGVDATVTSLADLMI